MSSKLSEDGLIQIMDLQIDLALKYGVHIGSRTVQIVGEITENTYIMVDSALTILEQDLSNEPITVRINSMGGSVYDALGIVGRIKSSKSVVNTEGFGAIMSAASLILAAGAHRKLSKYATLMYHEPSITSLEGTSTQVYHLAKNLMLEKQMWADTMASFTKKDSKFWASSGLLGKDLFLRPQECLELGVIDEVI